MVTHDVCPCALQCVQVTLSTHVEGRGVTEESSKGRGTGCSPGVLWPFPTDQNGSPPCCEHCGSCCLLSLGAQAEARNAPRTHTLGPARGSGLNPDRETTASLHLCTEASASQHPSCPFSSPLRKAPNLSTHRSMAPSPGCQFVVLGQLQ